MNAPVPAGLLTFGDEMRPCKLTTHVKSYPAGKNDFMFERNLNYQVAPIIVDHNNGKPTLVFCRCDGAGCDGAGASSTQVLT